MNDAIVVRDLRGERFSCCVCCYAGWPVQFETSQRQKKISICAKRIMSKIACFWDQKPKRKCCYCGWSVQVRSILIEAISCNWRVLDSAPILILILLSLKEMCLKLKMKFVTYTYSSWKQPVFVDRDQKYKIEFLNDTKIARHQK